MALDEALLALDGPPTLRWYAWQPHAVSLGCFQQFTAFADLGDLPMVRRRTGGGAIHHADELTFALVVPAAQLPGPVPAGYQLLHAAFVAALTTFGVRCRLQQGGRTCGARPGERWCFAEPGAGDVVDGRGLKLLGSAQRRVQQPQARILHHGSLVLRPPRWPAAVASVADQIEVPALPDLCAALTAAVAARLDLQPVPGALRDDEIALASRLAADEDGRVAFLRQR